MRVVIDSTNEFIMKDGALVQIWRGYDENSCQVEMLIAGFQQNANSPTNDPIGDLFGLTRGVMDIWTQGDN